MNTFSRVAVVLIAMTGVAAAQGAAKPPAPAAPVKQVPPTPKPADPAMEMKPPQELANAAKAMGGTWNCTGQAVDATMKMVPMTGKMKTTLAMGGWWLNSSFDAKVGKEPFHFESYTTFDAKSKRWKRVMVETGGGWSTGESAGMVSNKMDWELASHMAMGDASFKDHEDVSDPKAGAKLSGEMSMDGGKNWVSIYTMACKK